LPKREAEVAQSKQAVQPRQLLHGVEALTSVGVDAVGPQEAQPVVTAKHPWRYLPDAGELSDVQHCNRSDTASHHVKVKGQHKRSRTRRRTMSSHQLTPEQRTRRLADGNAIPLLGLGVWQVPDGPECVNAVRWALELGYGHIDTAQAYGNEQSVGQALRESGVPREQVFITTKFYPAHRDPTAEAERSLGRLGVDHIDLYMIHWPAGGPTWAWPGMERARELGYARSIGVSNFDVEELAQVSTAGSISPVVNQVHFSPFEYRRALLSACERRGVVLEAYSPLGTGRHLSHATVRRIAERLGRSSAQVLLRWCLERQIPVIPKSTHRERIAENAQIFDFSLSAEDKRTLDELDQTGGTGRAREHKWW
jgi:diketogulonate reductase-like aldo/keto reductase